MEKYLISHFGLIMAKVHSFNNRAITEGELLFQGIQFATIENIAILSDLQTPTVTDPNFLYKSGIFLFVTYW